MNGTKCGTECMTVRMSGALVIAVAGVLYRLTLELASEVLMTFHL